MLTGKAKIGYMMAYSGFVLFIYPALRAGSASRDNFDLALLLIATALFLIGSALVRSRSMAGVGRLLFRTPTFQSGKDWLALFLILASTFMLPALLRSIWSGGRISVGWPAFVLILSTLAGGWFLALSEFLPSRSPEK